VRRGIVRPTGSRLGLVLPSVLATPTSIECRLPFVAMVVDWSKSASLVETLASSSLERSEP
jgi:hypothetical protein